MAKISNRPLNATMLQIKIFLKNEIFSKGVLLAFGRGANPAPKGSLWERSQGLLPKGMPLALEDPFGRTRPKGVNKLVENLDINT